MEIRNFEATETLKDGRAVRIRAVRPDDKAGVVEAFGRLDPASIYTRFFRVKKALSDQELRTATEVDFVSVVALVVTITSGEQETIIGGGRYAIVDPSSPQRSAEVAFLVEEDFQGQGIAGRILQHLVRFGREQGVHQFEAEVLAQNRAMLGVFSRSGLPLKQSSADGVIHVTLSLGDGPEPA